MPVDLIEQYDDDKKKFLVSTWERIVIYLGTQHDNKKIFSFFNKTGIINIDEQGKTVTIWVPNEFILTQIKKFFEKALKEAVHEIYNPQFDTKIIVYTPFQNSNKWLLPNLKKILNVKEVKKTEIKKIEKTIKSELSNYFWILFDDHFTFDSFISWSSNQFAFSAAKAVAEHPWLAHNPLFLYGNVGLGKTHLMQAIGNEIMQTSPEKVVIYLPVTKLIDEIVTALRGNKLGALLKKFDEVDVLLIDDIQFLADKERTQEIFHNIFNDFQLKKKQIILSSDRPPKELTHIEPRLKSRFALWLVADIQPPDYETRIAILQSKLECKQESIDFDLLGIIAKYIKDNVRELEGALNILITRKKMLHQELTENEVFACLKTLWYVTQEKLEGPTMAQINKNSGENFWHIVEMVAQYYNLWVNDIKSDSRKKEITEARQILMMLAKKYFNRTLEKIGDYFWWKNHASVIYAINNTEKRLKTDSNMAHDYNVFVERIEK